jgi:hypothetical protein
VILRLTRGRGDATAVDALCADLKAKLGPGSDELASPARVHLATRPGASDADVLVTAFWGSAEAAASGDRREISPFSLARRHLADVVAEVFEIDDTILRRSDDEPELIRVATGTFSKRGADIEMLDLLRQRTPLIGDEMSEAFVGRRMVEHAVEVTFVSAWRSVPVDRPLDEPFWPDIALRYDSFRLAVYRTVLFGSLRS